MYRYTKRGCCYEAASRASTETCLCAWDTYLAETARPSLFPLFFFVSMTLYISRNTNDVARKCWPMM